LIVAGMIVLGGFVAPLYGAMGPDDQP
jgi:hypothetical protein